MGAKTWPDDEQELSINANHVQINMGTVGQKIYAECVMSTYPG